MESKSLEDHESNRSNLTAMSTVFNRLELRRNEGTDGSGINAALHRQAIRRRVMDKLGLNNRI